MESIITAAADFEVVGSRMVRDWHAGGDGEQQLDQEACEAAVVEAGGPKAGVPALQYQGPSGGCLPSDAHKCHESYG